MKALFIGVGNEHRRDDAVGLHVARRLRALRLPGLDVVEHHGDLTRLLDLWSSRERVFGTDAARSGAEPGTIHRVELPDEGLSASVRRTSTHSVGMGEAVELARTLGSLPARLVIYGIEGADFDPGEGLSRLVERALETVVRRVLEECGHVDPAFFSGG